MLQRFHLIVSLSMTALWASFEADVQAQHYGGPYSHGYWHRPHAYLADPHPHQSVHHLHEHDLWNGAVLIEEPVIVERSVEPIGSHHQFTQSSHHGLANFDDTFGGCPNATRCPHDARNFPVGNEFPSTYTRPNGLYESPSSAIRNPNWQQPSRTDHPNANTCDGLSHDGHNHEGHSHANELPSRSPPDYDPLTMPTLPRAAPLSKEVRPPNPTRPPGIWSTDPSERNITPGESQSTEPPIVMDSPPPKI